MIESYTDWTATDLWEHQQANFSAHLAMFYVYLRDHGMDPDDFIRYVGERAAEGWRECLSPQDMMNGILLNVLANGGTVRDVELSDQWAVAEVTGPLRPEIMRVYGADESLVDRSWEKYRPIAESLGLTFAWQSGEQDSYRIEVTRPSPA